tara:strand:- start:1341 stop:1841 length:501 start_codon:yes stop_codon:yes gene_type:complete
MWLVIKTKHNFSTKLLKQNLVNILGNDLKFFAPKMRILKSKSNKFFYKDFFVLGNYKIIYHPDLKKNTNINKIKYLKGIQYVLNTFNYCQGEIEKFIERCKNNEDSNGYLIQNFFELKKGNELKFMSGPFVNFVSELVDNQKKRICFLTGKYKILVNKNQSCISTG